MTIEEKDTLYARWLTGDITGEEETQLRASGAWEELEKLIAATALLSPPEYDAEAGFAQFKQQKMRPQARVRRLPLIRTLAIAASILLLIVGGLMWLEFSDEQLIAAHGTTETFQFYENSTVLLNDGSSIVYNEDDWEVQRVVNLTGEAFFKVEKGSPFRVETANGLVEVLGTSFNVRAWGKNLYVECYTGKVQVRQGNQSTTLTAQKAIDIINGEQQTVREVKQKQPLWMNGRSRFYEEDIQVVFAEMARQFAVEIKTPALNRSFSGSFQHDDLETALSNVCKPLGLDFTIKNKVVEIRE